jgi:CheY-like chemotaxis protein
MAENNKILNILIIENNPRHIVGAKNSLQDTCKHLKYDFVNSVYPNNKKDINIFTNKIVSHSKLIYSNREEIDNLYQYIIEQIEQNNINTIMLDFLLCDEEENLTSWTVQDTTGGKLVKKIKSSKYKNIPIISFTKLFEQLKQAALTGSEILFYLQKDFDKDFFVKNIGRLHQWTRKAEKFEDGKNKYCDIGVIFFPLKNNY